MSDIIPLYAENTDCQCPVSSAIILPVEAVIALRFCSHRNISEGENKMNGQEKNRSAESDWELSEAYYSQDAAQKELSLEDFIDDDSADLNAESGLCGTSAENDRLQRVAADVTRILALSSQGRTAAEIAQELEVEQQYVSDIMVCIQAFPEDNPLAVARLIVFG